MATMISLNDDGKTLQDYVRMATRISLRDDGKTQQDGVSMVTRISLRDDEKNTTGLCQHGYQDFTQG